jgi:hypothetical protein
MGVSQTGSISPGSKEYYKALLSGSNYILQIAPSIITGHIVIYMSCDVNIDELGMPSSDNYMWKYNPGTHCHSPNHLLTHLTTYSLRARKFCFIYLRYIREKHH